MNAQASTSLRSVSENNDVSLVSGMDVETHTPLMVPKKEKDYSNRPPCPIPRDPRQQATIVDVPAAIQPVIKQEVVFHSEVEIKEEKVEESESNSNWKEDFLRACPNLPSPNNSTDQESNPLVPSKSQADQEAPGSVNVQVKQEPVDEHEAEEQNDDQGSVSSGSTVGLPSPKRMESFSAPASPVNAGHSPDRSTQPVTLPSTFKYSAPLDLEEEYERMEREEENNLRKRAEESNRRSYSPPPDESSDDSHQNGLNGSFDHPRSPSPDRGNTSENKPSESMEIDNLPPTDQVSPPRKKSTFTVVKNPDFFKNAPAPTQEAQTSTSSNDHLNEPAGDQMDLEEAQTTRPNKIPVTKSLF